MTDLMRVLIVEDDNDQWETYEETASDLSNADIKIELERKNSAEEAISTLLSNNFDGAIVDLNLTQGQPHEASGNEVLKKIVGSQRFPVLVVSGNLQNLDDEIRNEKSDFLQFFDRDTSNTEIFECLIKVYKTGITRILGGRGKAEQLLGEIFWKHLSNEFNVWSKFDGDSEKTLLRYTVSHLGEYLDIPDGESRHYHEAEFYIKPPIRKYIATGDIAEFKDERYIVLSPSCDIAIRCVSKGVPEINTSRVIMAPLIRLNKENFLENGLINENDNAKNKEKVVSEIIKGQREKYALLPDYADLPPCVIDFQNIHTVTFEDFNKSANRLATVSGIFLKDIQSRFSSYLARQGQPDMDKNNLVKKYKKLLS